MKTTRLAVLGMLSLASLFAPTLWADTIEAELKLSPAGGFKATTEVVESDLKRNAQKQLQVIQVRFNIASLKTGIKLRDDHLHKHLQKDTHPVISLANIRLQGGQGSGDLTLAGNKQKIQFQFQDQGKVARFQFTLVPSKFGLKPVSYLGIKVKDQVQIAGSLDVD